MKTRVALLLVSGLSLICATCPPGNGGSKEPYDCENPPVLSGYVPLKVSIPNQYIVVLKRDKVRAVAGISAVADSLDIARENRVVFGLINGFSVRFDAKAAVSSVEAIAKDPRVAYIQDDGKKHTRDTNAGISWGLDRIDQRHNLLDGQYGPGAEGLGVHAYVIDTGVDEDEDLGDRYGECFAATGLDSCLDGHGHGTHVAGTVAGRYNGVAKGVIVHSARVLDSSGSGSDSQVIEGIDWAVNHIKTKGWRATLNLSLGGVASPALDEAVCQAVKIASVAVAAGNDFGDAACPYSPARVKQAITVGASNKNDERSDFSNVGECVDIFAPGERIESIGGEMSGTSMASPHVAGVVALYLERHPQAAPAQIFDGLLELATKDKLSGAQPNLLIFAKE